jgi:hypothetical protein
VICDGTGLHRPDFDEDLSVIGIIEGRFGLPSTQLPVFSARLLEGRVCLAE